KSKIFYVWGGEPFLYPDFMDLAAYMSKKMIFTVNTNGTFLAENAERIVKDKWTGIFISLDSFEDVNDSIRGKGTYKRVIEGMEAIKREKKAQKSTLPYVGIVSTMSNLNYMYLDKLAEAMKDKGLSWHIINLGTYMNQDIGDAHIKIMKEKLDIDPKYWKGFTSGFNAGIDGDKFAQILDKVHALDNGYPIITVPVIKPHKIGTYYSDLEVPVKKECAAGWFSVNINYNGDVHFCADYPDYIIGNIKNSNLMDIYNNERAVKFRKALKSSENGLFPACKRCYQLMLCGESCTGF
ncbi:MAG: radical SAM protein, partial [Spirochaetes bacterium RIFOXYB1_FULL_32_8]